MIVITRLDKIKRFVNPVVALGVFDGLHRGHLNILRAVVNKARETGGDSVVVTFYPHPQKEESLYSLEHRLKMFSELGLDVCVVINFNKHFSEMSAVDFISHILVEKIHPSSVYVGENFRFGKGASGDLKMLSCWARKGSFSLRVFKVVKDGRRPISSTAIRGLIKQGRLKEAGRLLGRRVSVLGTVISGSGIAGDMGFPTANINPHHEVIPPPGIYAVDVSFSGKDYGGACYIGTRPTICSKNKAVHIEVNIFGFHKKIYGKSLEIRFLKFLRSDKKFASLTELSSQILQDVKSCRAFISRSHNR
ncbi:MAG: riboflavin biosynthesis protein RibF [Candidatus Omnitrophica bacterium]|nr:riboflavin biosynthesis protein RibF [Candidatus Omnitrophota bacterium]MDD5042058.1 riboflavin biosynthesis protein RibF [Candidatus Omnitrophota bacterium]MDD5500250.1 riboflavin biosynthesis protein RibF [Candidatus Omnitrophota bacterium]